MTSSGVTFFLLFIPILILIFRRRNPKFIKMRGIVRSREVKSFARFHQISLEVEISHVSSRKLTSHYLGVRAYPSVRAMKDDIYPTDSEIDLILIQTKLPGGSVERRVTLKPS